MILCWILALMMVPFVCAEPQGYCKPDCTQPPPSLQVVNPYNCHQYYLCGPDQTPLGPLNCSEGEIFSNIDNKCIPGSRCDNLCSGQCRYTCGDPDGPDEMGDRYDSSVFYTCDDNRKRHPQHCPTKQFFDGLKCQKDEAKGCACKPFCSVDDVGKFVIDPTDCTNYYFCVQEGTPDSRFTCADGTNFDIMSGECLATAPCFKLCINAVQPNGCIDRYTCLSTGNHPKCVQRCDHHFYQCHSSDLGHIIQETKCLDSALYYHPDNSQCVKREDCPYPDPGV
ncbi:uncharacterized protein LOC121864981 [Homarus americanus]|uniref:Putative Chitin binding Peritrophin-A domain-containing protein 8 n=1 Tax=Homarus americanus TaxID=6706 RepID=A0A8J5TUH2_HOMAM|nr:uncharacterized protein LOC121864981 [Homarus americanus]KAG7177423.1 putative Chitin binding Peritrophin-A domain-containing protein 8 [Homarus americanus]